MLSASSWYRRRKAADVPASMAQAVYNLEAKTELWNAWCQGTITSSSTTASTIWTNWNMNWQFVGTTTGSTIAWNRPVESQDEYEERCRRYEELQAETARQWEADRVAKAAASQRAEELLLSLLSDEQAASWREHEWFAVRGSQSGRTYRIHATGIANNVDRMTADGKKRETVFCAHPAGLPKSDVHVAQMFLIATDEPEFLRIANAHRVLYDEEGGATGLRPVADLAERRVLTNQAA